MKTNSRFIEEKVQTTNLLRIETHDIRMKIE